jgi:four helix bundle protein
MAFEGMNHRSEAPRGAAIRLNVAGAEPQHPGVFEKKGGRKSPAPDLKDRTRDFALRIIRLYTALPKRSEAQIIGKQVLRSGTAVGANYREGLRARSKSEYAAKLNIGLMELEETLYWLELMEQAGIVPASRLASLKAETCELTAIFVALIKMARTKAKLEIRKQKAEEGAA